MKAQYTASSKEQEEDFMVALQKQATNGVLEHLASVDGLPMSAFLSRVCLVSPLNENTSFSLTRAIEEALARLTCYSTYDRKINYIEKVEPLHTLCQIVSTEKLSESFKKWMQTNSKRLNDALSTCLFLECQELAQECCFAVAFLARRLHFDMRQGIEGLLDALIRLMSRALLPREKNVAAFREARQLHLGNGTAKNSAKFFHPPPLTYKYSEVYRRLIGVIYYTLADVIFNIPIPELIRYFTFRIFRRREIARLLLYQILDSIVSNLSEIQEEAESLAESFSPEKDIKEVYDVEIWRLLPSVLYVDILKAFSEINIADREYPNAILHLLRTQATMKYSLMDEKTLLNVQNYWAENRFFDVSMEKVPRLSLNLPSIDRGPAKSTLVRRDSVSGSVHSPV